jgi:chromate transporter
VRAFATSFDAPVFGSIDPWSLALAVVAGISLFRLKLGVMPTLGICSAASIALYFVLGAV